VIKFLCVVFFLSNYCYSFPSKEVENNLQIAWHEEKIGKHKKAIALCTWLIEDERISNLDRLHYLIARSVFHLSNDDMDGFYVDYDVLKYLYFAYPACAEELFSSYEISFLNN